MAARETTLMHPTGNHSDKRTFGYDSHGRLSTFGHSLDGGADVTLWTGSYNAVGQLATTRLYYGPFEYLGNSLARINVHGGYMDVSGKFHAYATDWQGNVRAVVSKQGSGAVAEQATWYYPYGMPTCDSRSAAVNRYKYTGKELIIDHATNLYDYPARLYDPVLGRWLSVDPMQELYYEISSYVFCHNNPIIYVDPDGNTDFLNEVTLDHKFIKDNVNQVIMISNSDYQILVSQNFDQTTKEYTSIIAGGTPRTDLFPTIENVLDGKAFIPYSSEGDCLKCALKQNNSAITGPMNRIDLYNISENTFNYTGGVEYIKTQLIEGKSVVTGVSYGKNVDNINPSTSHFLNIVGMGFEIGKNGVQNYFSYYDNANRAKGTNLDNNKFYQSRVSINNSYVPVLYDNTNLCVGGTTQYIVTEVRRNR